MFLWRIPPGVAHRASPPGDFCGEAKKSRLPVSVWPGCRRQEQVARFLAGKVITLPAEFAANFKAFFPLKEVILILSGEGEDGALHLVAAAAALVAKRGFGGLAAGDGVEDRGEDVGGPAAGKEHLRDRRQGGDALLEPPEQPLVGGGQGLDEEAARRFDRAAGVQANAQGKRRGGLLRAGQVIGEVLADLAAVELDGALIVCGPPMSLVTVSRPAWPRAVATSMRPWRSGTSAWGSAT